MKANSGLWLYNSRPDNAIDSVPYIKEGLIRTYPCDYVLRSLKTTFKLSDNFSDFNPYEHVGIAYSIDGCNETEVIIVHMVTGPFDKQNKLILDSFMHVRGWFKANEKIVDYCQGVDMWCMNYEKRFDDLHSELPEHIYHLTLRRCVGKIKHYGFEPKESGWKLFNNEARVYFFTKKPTMPELRHLIDTFNKGKRINVDSRNPKEQEQYALITLSTKLVDRNLFYNDPRMPGAVFTLEGVHPRAIESVEIIDYAPDTN